MCIPTQYTPCNLGPRLVPSFSVSEPQNFGITDLRHHFATYGPVGGCIVGGSHGVVAAQSIMETSDFFDFQQVMIVSPSTFSLNPMFIGQVLLGLVLILCPGLCQLQLQVQQDLVGLHIPQTVL